jgi:hypothetical protein
MTIDGFLTLLALVVAVVAVIPPAMRRAMDFKFGLSERFIILASFVIVLFLEYYDTAKVIFHIPSISLAHTLGITPQSLAFLVVIVSGIYAGAVVRWNRIPSRRMGKLKRLIETLVEAEKFGDTMEILSPYIGMIGNIHADGYEQKGNRRRRECKNVAAASDIIRIIFLSAKLAQYIARSKPYVAVEMLKNTSLK